jgi:hypothetical protein
LWLFTDASGSGLGAALFQGKEWKLVSPIVYESHLMTPEEQSYPVHEQELLAVVHALQKWKMLLLGMNVHVMSDHHSLTHLLKQCNLSRQQARWVELLADFDLEFEYIRGEDNMVADALSWKDNPKDPPTVTPEGVACVAALTQLGPTLSDALRQRILAGYAQDAFCTTLKRNLPLHHNSIEVAGLLFVDGRLVIPAAGDLHRNLMEEAHSRLGHLGYLKTFVGTSSGLGWLGTSKNLYNPALCASGPRHPPQRQQERCSPPLSPKLLSPILRFILLGP